MEAIVTMKNVARQSNKLNLINWNNSGHPPESLPVHFFQIELELRVLVSFMEGGNCKTQRKILRAM